MPENINCLFYGTTLCPLTCELHKANFDNLNSLAPQLANILRLKVNATLASGIIGDPEKSINIALIKERIQNEERQNLRYRELTQQVEGVINQRETFAQSQDRNKCFQFNPK